VISLNSPNGREKKSFAKTIVALAMIVGLVMAIKHAPAAAATEDSYLSALMREGVLVYGGEQCFQYRGDDGCSLRFASSEHALTTGNWVCAQLRGGDSLPEVIYNLTWGDGMSLSPDNANRVAIAAYSHLC